MKLFELQDAVMKLGSKHGNPEVTVRCSWEPIDETPNGNCFRLNSVVIDEDHSTGELFVALDCDQEAEGA